MTTMKTIELYVNFIQDPIEKPPIILVYDKDHPIKTDKKSSKNTKGNYHYEFRFRILTKQLTQY